MIALAAGAINAQEPGRGKIKQKHGEAIQKLNLSDKQKAEFKAIHEDFRKQMAELKKKDDITVKEWRSKQAQLHKDHYDKMQSVLTADQKSQLNKMKEERKTQMKAMHEKRGKMMKEKLALSDDQSKKLKDMHEANATKMKAIHDNKNLTMEQKKEQSKELKKQSKEQLKSILTEEQMKKMQERKIRERGRKQVI
jgi:Spy/CpxP family protein refolding chaperone